MKSFDKVTKFLLVQNVIPPHAGAKMGTITVTIFAFFSEIQLLNKQKVVE